MRDAERAYHEREAAGGGVRVLSETLTLEERNVQEEFFERGWTDGLPIVPPTPGRVEQMLAAVGAEDPKLLIGFLPQRGVGVTLEKAAINAVLAEGVPSIFRSLWRRSRPRLTRTSICTRC